MCIGLYGESGRWCFQVERFEAVMGVEIGFLLLEIWREPARRGLPGYVTLGATIISYF